jgi:hypothetical protein
MESDDYIFSATIPNGKWFNSIVAFAKMGLEDILFTISHDGLRMNSDNRPLNNNKVRESLSAALFVPNTAFIPWRCPEALKEKDENGDYPQLPICIDSVSLRSAVGGSILVKDRVTLYVKASDTKKFYVRVTEEGGKVKLEAGINMVREDLIPQKLKEPLEKPYYGPDARVSGESKAIANICKAVSKIEVITMNVHKEGLMFVFASNSVSKSVPIGNVSGPILYTQKFKTKKVFLTLGKCTALNTTLSIYCAEGKPTLFEFGVLDTGGTLSICLVPDST